MSDREDLSKRPLSWGERQEQRVEQKRARAQQGEPARSRWLARRWRGVLRALRVRSVVLVDGVRYRERSTVSLRRALSESGAGVKEYRVRFVQGGQRETMKIRATRSRIYNDLSPDPRALIYRQITELIRPGSRVLELGAGTGGGSCVLSECVGPSGGVVAVNRDGESVRFARQRYRLENTGFELGWIETLGGEIDGGFDAVCAVDPMREADDDPARSSVMGELWRILAPGGVLVMLYSSPAGGLGATDRLEAAGATGLRTLENTHCPSWVAVVGMKGKQRPPTESRKGPPEAQW